MRYVEKRYYIADVRYTTSGFMRLRLASGLAQRDVSSEVVDTKCEALRHIDQGETE